MDVVVSKVVLECDAVRSFELVHPNGLNLPSFSPGSHIEVSLPSIGGRQYSLCNNPLERHRYLIGVRREAEGRGGSRWLHDEIAVQSKLSISAPRNHFPLAESAKEHLLVAGGIGVTPMMSMVEYLDSKGCSFQLQYFTRSPSLTPFRATLARYAESGRVTHHFDNEGAAAAADLVALLAEQKPGTHLYYCGPPGFMATVRTAAAKWEPGTVHFEHFEPPIVSCDEENADKTFFVRVLSTGAIYAVPPGKSIASVLRDKGLSPSISCEQGVCGSCQTRYLRGEPEHRDFILTEDERKAYIMICCSRARSGLIELDI